MQPQAGSSSPRCFTCDYNLAGLDLPIACPECGHWNSGIAPTRDTIAPRWFRWARLGWASSVLASLAIVVLVLALDPRAYSTSFPDGAANALLIELAAGIPLVLLAAVLRRWHTLVAILMLILCLLCILPAMGTA